MRETLFRQEVIDQQNERFLGSVLIRPPWQFSFSVYLLLALFVTVLSFLVLGTYHRKEKAIGHLRPSSGLVKVFAPRSGIIESLAVQEGELVSAGNMLFSLGQERIAANGNDVAELQKSELEALQNQLLARKDALPPKKAREAVDLRSDLSRIDRNLQHLNQQLKISETRLELKRSRQARLESLAETRAISRDEVERNKDEILLFENQMKTAQQNLLVEESRRQTLETRLSDLDAQYATEESQILQELHRSRQQLMELSLVQQQQIRAPITGRVTALQAHPGMQVTSDRPILTLLPEGSVMEAHLYVPTRAIGFLAKGQEVLLQYDAFPYQKYGVFSGRIEGVAQSPLNAREILDIDLSHEQEPLYRVTVKLETQTIPAMGQMISLQSGMTLKADIILEERRLWEWLWAPLYRVRS
jgi:membrane fusion protein